MNFLHAQTGTISVKLEFFEILSNVKVGSSERTVKNPKKFDQNIFLLRMELDRSIGFSLFFESISLFFGMKDEMIYFSVKERR